LRLVEAYHTKHFFRHFAVWFSFNFDGYVATHNVNKNIIHYEYFKGNSDQASNIFSKRLKRPKRAGLETPAIRTSFHGLKVVRRSVLVKKIVVGFILG
jgi:hypothetical protein